MSPSVNLLQMTHKPVTHVNLIVITVFNLQIIGNGLYFTFTIIKMWKFRKMKPPGQEKQDLINKFFHHDLFYAAICWWKEVTLLHCSSVTMVMKHNAGQ